MKTLLLTLLIGMTPFWGGFAQPGPGTSGIEMFLDFARFRYDETHTYLEIYYLLYDVERDSAAGSQKEVYLDFALSDIDKDSLLASSKLTVDMGQGTANQNGQAAVQGSLIKTVLPPGKYMIKMVHLNDSQDRRIDSLSHKFSITPFKTDKISMSDIELASNIIAGSSNKKGLFYKNTMEVFPNPMKWYGRETSRLYYYAELYNLKSDNPEDMVDIEVSIRDTEGNVQAQKKYKKKCRYESSVEVGSFDVSSFKNGVYTLNLSAYDAKIDSAVNNWVIFYILNSEEFVGEGLMTAYSRSEFLNMSEEEVDQKFDQARYVATQNEMEIYKTLDSVESKRIFLFKFWREREREGFGLMQEYYERIEYANEMYPFSGLKGWETDRGRVYVKYGEPDQIERHPYERDAHPYVVWFYHELDGGAKFLFMDESGFGDFRLMTSTLRGEIYDPTYDELLIFN